METIPLDKLNVGDRVIATSNAAWAAKGGVPSEIHTGVILGITELRPLSDGRSRWYVRLMVDGETLSRTLLYTDGPLGPSWTFTVDPADTKRNARGLTEVIKYATVDGKPVASDPLEHIVAPMLGLTRTKKGGRRRRKTRGKLRKSRT